MSDFDGIDQSMDAVSTRTRGFLGSPTGPPRSLLQIGDMYLAPIRSTATTTPKVQHLVIVHHFYGGLSHYPWVIPICNKTGGRGLEGTGQPICKTCLKVQAAWGPGPRPNRRTGPPLIMHPSTDEPTSDSVIDNASP